MYFAGETSQEAIRRVESDKLAPIVISFAATGISGPFSFFISLSLSHYISTSIIFWLCRIGLRLLSWKPNASLDKIFCFAEDGVHMSAALMHHVVSADILFNSSMHSLLLCNIYGIYDYYFDVNCYHCITLNLAMIICRLSVVVYKSCCSSSLLF